MGEWIGKWRPRQRSGYKSEWGRRKMGGEINSHGSKPRAGQAPYSVYSLKSHQGRCCWLPPWLRAALHALRLVSMEFWDWRGRTASDLELWVREPQGLGVPCWGEQHSRNPGLVGLLHIRTQGVKKGLQIWRNSQI